MLSKLKRLFRTHTTLTIYLSLTHLHRSFDGCCVHRWIFFTVFDEIYCTPVLVAVGVEISQNRWIWWKIRRPIILTTVFTNIFQFSYRFQVRLSENNFDPFVHCFWFNNVDFWALFYPSFASRAQTIISRTRGDLDSSFFVKVMDVGSFKIHRDIFIT